MAFDWKSLLGTVAPALATALCGPLAGLAVTAVGSALGFGDEATEEQVAQALSRATPEQLLALKLADQDFAVDMKKCGIDLERIRMEDRNSARQREASTGDSWTPRILASVTMGAFLVCIWFVFSEKMTGMDAAQIALIGGVVGYASAKADTVIAYYFGSSSSSDGKDAMIYNSTPSARQP